MTMFAEVSAEVQRSHSEMKSTKTELSSRSSSSRSSSSRSLGSTKQLLKLLPMEERRGTAILRSVSVQSNGSSDGDQQILTAAAVGDVEQLKEMLENGVNIEVVDGSDRTPLHIASYHGQVRFVKALIEAGADVHATDYLQKTALHQAAWKGYKHIVILLLRAGCRATDCDKSGKTPLHHVAEWGAGGSGTHLYTAVADLILSHGAVCNATDNDGRTALHLALLKGHTEVAMHLVACGADLRAGDSKGQTSLHLACAAECSSNVIGALVDRGAHVDQRDFSGRTALHGATRKAAQALLQRGADINSRDFKGKTPLHVAADKLDMDMIAVLVEAGAEVNAYDKCSGTPLDYAKQAADSSLKGQKKAVVALLKAQGARKGISSLFAACFRPIY